VLLCIAHDPGARLRDIAARAGITERSAYAIVTDLTAAGYVMKQKDGRRNRYQIQAHLPLPDPGNPGPRHRRDPGPAYRRRREATAGNDRDQTEGTAGERRACSQEIGERGVADCLCFQYTLDDRAVVPAKPFRARGRPAIRASAS
jgi:hypothetical protein